MAHVPIHGKSHMLHCFEDAIHGQNTPTDDEQRGDADGKSENASTTST